MTLRSVAVAAFVSAPRFLAPCFLAPGFLAPFLLTASVAEAAPLKAVVFDLEPVESSFEALGSAQANRVKIASVTLRKLLTESGQVSLVDTTPAAAEIEKNLPLYNCHDCDLDIAKKLGADVEVTTAVQKNSNLILGFSGSIKDVKTGKVLSSGLVTIRGDNDDMWAHGVKFLVKERLLDPPLPASPEALRAKLDK